MHDLTGGRGDEETLRRLMIEYQQDSAAAADELVRRIPLALSHCLISLIILTCLPKSLTGRMRLGHAYFRL